MSHEAFHLGQGGQAGCAESHFLEPVARTVLERLIPEAVPVVEQQDTLAAQPVPRDRPGAVIEIVPPWNRQHEGIDGNRMVVQIGHIRLQRQQRRHQVSLR